MDLREQARGGNDGLRHPWERARATALRQILARGGWRGGRALDIGCGDGYAAREILAADAGLVGFDPALSAAQVAAQEGTHPGVRYCRSRLEIPSEPFDLLLLLDVLEHVDAPVEYLADLAAQHLAPGGLVLITVPAFQALWSAHDDFLDHRRRYDRGGILALARGAGLRPHSSGYLFGSLLLPRALSVALQRLFARWWPAPRGVGAWRGGAATTALVTRALEADNALLLALAARGVPVPGLTVWTLCRRP